MKLSHLNKDELINMVKKLLKNDMIGGASSYDLTNAQSFWEYLENTENQDGQVRINGKLVDYDTLTYADVNDERKRLNESRGVDSRVQKGDKKTVHHD